MPLWVNFFWNIVTFHLPLERYSINRIEVAVKLVKEVSYWYLKRRRIIIIPYHFNDHSLSYGFFVKKWNSFRLSPFRATASILLCAIPLSLQFNFSDSQDLLICTLATFSDSWTVASSIQLLFPSEAVVNFRRYSSVRTSILCLSWKVIDIYTTVMLQ